MSVLFTDFNDSPATGSPDEAYSIVSPLAVEFFEAVSYGRMELVLRPHLTWLRLRQHAASYGDGLDSWARHKAHLEEAVALADDAVDFSDSDLVLVIDNPDTRAIPYGPAWIGNSGTGGFLAADGAQITNGVTSGADLAGWGGLWLNHEMGHSLGLPDLYSYETGSLELMGEFSMMSNIGGQAPEYLAYERWLLGWLEDDQIVCHDHREVTATLGAIEFAGGPKAVMVPLSGARLVVVESRRALGFDAGLIRPGALVYSVDSSIDSGFGPIKVENGAKTLWPGESVTVDGVTIEVVDADETSDTVRVTVGES